MDKKIMDKCTIFLDSAKLFWGTTKLSSESPQGGYTPGAHERNRTVNRPSIGFSLLLLHRVSFQISSPTSIFFSQKLPSKEVTLSHRCQPLTEKQ